MAWATGLQAASLLRLVLFVSISLHLFNLSYSLSLSGSCRRGPQNHREARHDACVRSRSCSSSMRRSLSLRSLPNDDFDSGDGIVRGRRSFLARSGALLLPAVSIPTSSPRSADARGLVRFPCKEPLLNTYHLMRAGTSLLEEEDVWSTNPLFLTNREAALSDVGVRQVREACRYIASSGSSPTIVRYSIAAAGIDSANIVGEELGIGRDRLVPEFNYMDPRAIGGWDFSQLNQTEEAVWALDVDEAGVYGRGGKPPLNEDGTPSETLADQVVRLTNLMSVLETLYSGDTLLLVFPDGTGPALLSCLIAGVPLYRVHELQFQPGEVRCGIDYNSVNLMASRPPAQSYLDAIDRGRVELKQLRENPDILRNVKDLEFENERQREKELANVKEIESRKKEAKQKEEAKTRELEQKRKREEDEREKKAQAKARELEQRRKRDEVKRKIQKQRANGEDSPGVSNIGIFATIAGGLAVIAASYAGSDDADETASEGSNLAAYPVDDSVEDYDSTDAVRVNETKAEPEVNSPVISVEDDKSDEENAIRCDEEVLTADKTVEIAQGANNETIGEDLVDEDMAAGDSTPSDGEIIQSAIDFDDWDDAWLGSMSEIMNESSDE